MTVIVNKISYNVLINNKRIHKMIQITESFEYKITILNAQRSAQYFIDRGTDARGSKIHRPDLYMDAAIRNAKRRALR